MKALYFLLVCVECNLTLYFLRRAPLHLLDFLFLLTKPQESSKTDFVKCNLLVKVIMLFLDGLSCLFLLGVFFFFNF